VRAVHRMGIITFLTTISTFLTLVAVPVKPAPVALAPVKPAPVVLAPVKQVPVALVPVKPAPVVKIEIYN
jgi:hypothetical protein